jgi:predicted Zn-dependent peptidase
MRSLVTGALLLIAGGGLTAGADEFVPADLYAYEVLHYPNGFTAVLNPRHVSRSVSYRLVVNVGQLDFDCPDRELPHLAEHLMFGGTGELSEIELEAIVSALGGSWNAYTEPWHTEYHLDIFSGHALEGLGLLHRMFTGTVITEARLASARGVLHAESGGRPGMLRQLAYRRGLLEGAVSHAYRQFVPGTRAWCERIPTTEHIGLEMLDAFLDHYHRPRNMVLVAVGDFDRNALEQAITATFAALPDTGAAPAPRERAALEPRPVHYRTRLNPLVGNTTHLTVEVLLDNVDRLETAAFVQHQLAAYLDARLYDELRVVRGLAYGPGAEVVDQGDFRVLMLEAEVDHDDAGLVLDLMRSLLAEVAGGAIPADESIRQRQGLLYRLAAELDRNASFAAIYVDASESLARGAPLPDIQAAIEGADAEQVRALAAVLDLQRVLVYEAAPTVTYRGLGWLLLAVVIGAGWLAWRLLRRRA